MDAPRLEGEALASKGSSGCTSTFCQAWAELGSGAPDGICIDADTAVWYGDVPHQRCVRVREGGEVLQMVDLDRGAFACMLGGSDGMALLSWRHTGPAGEPHRRDAVGRASDEHASRYAGCRLASTPLGTALDFARTLDRCAGILVEAAWEVPGDQAGCDREASFRSPRARPHSSAVAGAAVSGYSRQRIQRCKNGGRSRQADRDRRSSPRNRHRTSLPPAGDRALIWPNTTSGPTGGVRGPIAGPA